MVQVSRDRHVAQLLKERVQRQAVGAARETDHHALAWLEQLVFGNEMRNSGVDIHPDIISVRGVARTERDMGERVRAPPPMAGRHRRVRCPHYRLASGAWINRS